jgi:pimeloyl-ACP methyl ester carboxylesterase
MDISLLIDHLPSYVFPDGRISITQHLCLGVSLGGHTTWQLLVHEPRITTCIIIIGSADFVRLLTDRARLSKIPDYVGSSPPGKDLLGSESFPNALVQAIAKFDAAQRIMGASYSATKGLPSMAEIKKLRAFYNEHLARKSLLVVSGGADKMAPYSRSEPVIEFLKKAIDSKTGWWKDGGMELRNVVFQGVKHELTLDMVAEAVGFIVQSVAGGSGTIRNLKL